MTAGSESTESNKVADLYDSFGPLLSMIWDDNYHFGYWDGPDDDASIAEATDRFTDLLVAKLGVDSRHRVLDAGCGVGKPGVRLALSTGAAVVGVSTNADQVRKASERASAAGVAGRVTFEQADVMRLPYEDAAFDAVLAFESLVHMNRVTALRELARVTRPGGRIVLTDLTLPESIAYPDEQAEKLSSLVRIAAYPSLVSEAALEIEELVDVSRNVANTVPRIRGNLERHRDDVKRLSGVDPEAVHESTVASQVDVADIGCLVAVLTVPAHG